MEKASLLIQMKQSGKSQVDKKLKFRIYATYLKNLIGQIEIAGHAWLK